MPAKKDTQAKKRKASTADIADPEHSTLGVDYVMLTTHSGHFDSNPVEMDWGNKNPAERGPVIATVKHGGQRNAIGAHGGGYCIYTALAVAAGELATDHKPNLNLTAPTDLHIPQPSWFGNKTLVTIDPWGHMVTDAFKPYFDK